MLAEQVTRAFPDLAQVRDPGLRERVVAQWRLVEERGPGIFTDIEDIPIHPTLPKDRYGALAGHVRAQMSIARTIVETYRREWGIALALDHLLVCAAVHDSAKVIEFVERNGGLVATPGFDHAVEGARIAREVGFPEEVVHMVAVHTYLGKGRLPRTRAAQLFQVLDPVCLPVFPEDGQGATERHLEANGVEPLPLPEDLR